jgi:hypothetical protein
MPGRQNDDGDCKEHRQNSKLALSQRTKVEVSEEKIVSSCLHASHASQSTTTCTGTSTGTTTPPFELLTEFDRSNTIMYDSVNSTK